MRCGLFLSITLNPQGASHNEAPCGFKVLYFDDFLGDGQAIRFSSVAAGRFCFDGAWASFLSLRPPAKTKPPASTGYRSYPCRKKEMEKPDGSSVRPDYTTLYRTIFQLSKPVRESYFKIFHQ